MRSILPVLVCLAGLIGPMALLAAENDTQKPAPVSLTDPEDGWLDASEIGPGDHDQGVTAGGIGFRYLVARQHGLHMGLDVARGPADPVIYVVFGNAWLRP